MKQKYILPLILILSLLTSCLGQRTRDEGLLPAARLAWGTVDAGVRSDIDRGIADAISDGDLTDSAPLAGQVADLESALVSGDRTQLGAISWDVLRPYGARGIQDRIDDGEMAPIVSLSLIERLNNFGFALEELKKLYVMLPYSGGRSPRFYPVTGLYYAKI